MNRPLNRRERLALISEIEAGEEFMRRRTFLETTGRAGEIRERCSTFAGFVREAWHVLEPETPFVPGYATDAICEHLEAVASGEITRLLMNVPPGSSKSMLTSVLFQAYEWGPRGRLGLRYLTTSFSDIAVKRDTRKTRDLILSPWYRALWPDVKLTRTGETSFANTATGFREGSPFGSLTSLRGDRLGIDDPHSTTSAESPAERETTVRKFREGAMNRLNDQARSAIMVIMQRLHEGDISGVILAEAMGFDHLMLPMRFEEARRCVTRIGYVDPRTEEGELLDPVRFPEPVLAQLENDMGAYAVAGQYQQRPAPRDGALFKRSWFGFLGAKPAGFLKTVRAWDLAATKKQASNKPDWTAGVKVSRLPDGRFLVEGMIRLQASSGDVHKTVKATAAVDGRGVRIRIPQDPGQAGKDQAETYIKELAGYTVIAERPTGDKTTRAEPAAVQAEAGNVLILRTGDDDLDAWIEPFLAELCLFPAGAHDDQVDAFADAVTELALGSSYTLANL